MKRNQSGTGIFEALLVLVLIGILVFTGWYVVKAKHNSTENLGSAITASQSSPASTLSGAPSTQLSSGTDNQSLESDLNNINASQNQASSDNTSAGTALNDQQSEISVPTN